MLLKAAVASVLVPAMDELEALKKGDIKGADVAMDNIIERLELLGYHFHRHVDQREALDRLVAVVAVMGATPAKTEGPVH